MIEINEDIINTVLITGIAKEIIEKLSIEERNKILIASVEKTFTEVVKPWNVQESIKIDVNKYMLEYLKDPKVQENIKESTRRSVDKLMDGVISTIIYGAQDVIKSDYKKFIEKDNKSKF